MLILNIPQQFSLGERKMAVLFQKNTHLKYKFKRNCDRKIRVNMLHGENSG